MMLPRLVLGLVLSLVLAAPQPREAAGALSAVWVNDGGDKVTREELRASSGGNVVNSVWDGSTVSLFGAGNETVSFNLILESAGADSSGLTVSLSALTGPDGTAIPAGAASGEGVFNYIGRNIELFYVRYLQIRGLNTGLAYDDYDERHVPSRCRRPWTGEGEGVGGWADRPCAGKYFPDLAVPLEWVGTFGVAAGENQSIWCDIYIPKGAPTGTYTGSLTVTETGASIRQIPVRLQVRGFSLPDSPSAKTMLVYGQSDVNYRYLGQRWLEEEDSGYSQGLDITDRHFQMAHRHKISLIEDYISPEEMDQRWLARLDGGLFTAARGYDGVGIGVGNNVYSIGTYGSWPWAGQGREAMWTNADAWVTWFESRSLDEAVEYFLYLIDESEDFALLEQYAAWMDQNPGPGSRLPSMATIELPRAQTQVPSLDIPAANLNVGPTEEWQSAADHYVSDPARRFYYYNGARPASGSYATEDDGVALRVNGWIQFEKKIDRWFYWESTYYTNYQCYGYGEVGDTNVFDRAQTYGCYDSDDPFRGQTGWNYFNGDGVLFYPGTDLRFPEESYGMAGPIASLRLKHWRRGIQDMDYLVLAEAVDPAATRAIVNRMIPKSLWDNGVDSIDDPTWAYCDISWSIAPDDWEAARAELADLIEGGQPGWR